MLDYTIASSTTFKALHEDVLYLLGKIAHSKELNRKIELLTLLMTLEEALKYFSDSLSPCLQRAGSNKEANESRKDSRDSVIS